MITCYAFFHSNFEMADGAILMFDVTNWQSLINLLSDKDNTRKIKRSWKKELMFRAIDNKHPMMILGKHKPALSVITRLPL